MTTITQTEQRPDGGFAFFRIARHHDVPYEYVLAHVDWFTGRIPENSPLVSRVRRAIIAIQNDRYGPLMRDIMLAIKFEAERRNKEPLIINK